MNKILTIIAFLLLPVIVLAGDDQVRLKVFYLEFPPYYFTNTDRKPDGFLLKEADKILRAAGYSPQYEAMPAKRILQHMHTLAPAVSIGWFKTPEREKFAKFSLPIYQNRPLQVVFLNKNRHLFDSKDTLDQILQDERVSIGLLGGYSYGAVVDHKIKAANPPHQLITGGYPQLFRMLAAERFTYLLVAPEEVDVLIKKNHLAVDQFGRMNLDDIPSGNERYLMFSKGVPSDVVLKVNRVVEKMKKNN